MRRFDTFIISYLGFAREVDRKQAYHEFLNRIGEDRPASLPTIRRWFGVRDFKEPSREQVIRIAFSMQLPLAEAETFLQKGIGEPSFQINDYTEIIAMYCLENHHNFAKYESMVAEYERNLQVQQEISHEFNTQWLYQQFEHIKHVSEEDFMYWMWAHANIFKGYSKTVQEYLNKYRDSVLGYMRKDAKRRLELLLSETGYEEWRKKKRQGNNTKELELIKKYARRHVSENLYENIIELAKLAYSETGHNTKLLAELFSLPGRPKGAQEETSATSEEGKVQSVPMMTGKYLSDLFNIPHRNEMGIHVKQAIRELEQREADAPCPTHVTKMVAKYSKENPEFENTEEALDWLREFDRESKRRRLVVKRGDLLPMILYVAQQRYIEETCEQDEYYNQTDALKVFRNLADATMIACNMAPLDERYAYDRMLLSYYQEEDMYGYGDVVE